MAVQLEDFPSLEQMQGIAETTPPKSVRVWGRVISQLYKNTCVVTGLTKEQVLIERHHIFNVYDYPKLQLSIFNGITLTRELHLMFHRMYGQNVTSRDLLDFFKVLEKTEYKKHSDRLINARVWVLQLEKMIFLNVTSNKFNS